MNTEPNGGNSLTGLQEYRQAIKTYRGELPDGWRDNVIRLYNECVEYGRNALDDAEYAGLLSEYGDFVMQQRLYDKAEAVLTEAQECCRKLYAADPQRYGLNLIRASMALADYYAKPDPGKAESILEEASSIAEGIKDCDVLLHAELLKRRCRKGIDEGLCKRAIEMLDADDKEDSPKRQIARLQLLGQLNNYLIEPDCEPVEQYYRQALELQDRYCEETGEEPDFSIYKDLLDFYEQTGQFDSDKFHALYGRYIFKIVGSRLRNANPNLYLEYMENLHINYCSMIDDSPTGNSSDEIEAALQCITELFNKHPVHYARRYVDDLCKCTIQWSESSKLDVFAQSLAFLRTVDAPRSWDYWYARRAVCEVLCRLFYIGGDYRRTIDMCEELLSIAEHEEEVFSAYRREEKVQIHAWMSRLCYAESHLEHAESHFNEAMRLIKGDENDLELDWLDLDVIWAICLMHFRHQRWGETIYWIMKALDEWAESTPADGEASVYATMYKAKIYILLSIMCEKQGDLSPAAKFKERASFLVDYGHHLMRDNFIENPTDSMFEELEKKKNDYSLQCRSIAKLLDENGDYEGMVLYRSKMDIYDPSLSWDANSIEDDDFM